MTDRLSDQARWRRAFPAQPELTFDVERMTGLVAERVHKMGVDDVVTGIGPAGVVGVVRGNRTLSGRVARLRADMDALTSYPWCSMSWCLETEWQSCPASTSSPD